MQVKVFWTNFLKIYSYTLKIWESFAFILKAEIKLLSFVVQMHYTGFMLQLSIIADSKQNGVF